ncbi:LAGLIDADG family homing endonuclease, partial [Riemerella anatipestifer]|uniref:LAGLIDADG family homing endonuclease n=1 Tax=Riemerella anatipestifer TaxID=34085 RepID=UPI003D9C850E
MGFFHFSTQSSCLDKKDELSTKVFPTTISYIAGFTDAEGNFLIIKDREHVKFRFKISLHIDDVKVLHLIKSKLNVGRVTVE